MNLPRWLRALTLLVVGTGLLGCGPWRARKANHDVRELDLALSLYLVEHERYPTGTPAEIARLLLGESVGGQNLKRLSYIEAKPRERNAAGEFIDPWGNPYQIVIHERLFVYSFGPNRIDEQGQGDDIAAGTPPVFAPQ